VGGSAICRARALHFLIAFAHYAPIASQRNTHSNQDAARPSDCG